MQDAISTVVNKYDLAGRYGLVMRDQPQNLQLSSELRLVLFAVLQRLAQQLPTRQKLLAMRQAAPQMDLSPIGKR